MVIHLRSDVLSTSSEYSFQLKLIVKAAKRVFK